VEQGLLAGIATHNGAVLTYKVLTEHHRYISRSVIREAMNPKRQSCSVFIPERRCHPTTQMIRYLFSHIRSSQMVHVMEKPQ
jgi:hypothetical protein